MSARIELETDRPTRFLVLSPGPGDADADIGGSVARWIAEGAVAQLVCLTSGDADGAKPSTDPLVMAATREREQRAAAEIIGYETVTFMHRPDGAVANDLALREQLVRLLRTFEPDTLVAPDPRVLIGPTGRINEADRRATGLAAIDAISPARQQMSNHRSAGGDGLKPWTVERLVLSAAVEPETAVDITETLEQKLAALRVHVSGSRDVDSVVVAARARASAMGERVGVNAAEALAGIALEHD
jgi:LmbE family N-acetylglucosaminyl deacetylase